MCLYVGMSENIRNRMYQHRMSPHNSKLDSYFSAFATEIEVAFVEMKNKTKKELLQLEEQMISMLRPSTNKAKTQ